MENKDFPEVPLTLLEALEERFPERSPRKGESMEDLMWRGGCRSVIAFLRSIHENQNSNQTILKGTAHVQS